MEKLETIISLVPARRQKAAKKLFAFVKNAKKHLQLSDAGLVMRNERIIGNIVDLVCDASFVLPARPEGWQEFVDGLVALEVPLALVGNRKVATYVRDALEHKTNQHISLAEPSQNVKAEDGKLVSASSKKVKSIGALEKKASKERKGNNKTRSAQDSFQQKIEDTFRQLPREKKKRRLPVTKHDHIKKVKIEDDSLMPLE